MPSIVPRLALASLIVPLCTNAAVTGLIIGKIWHMSKDTALYELPTRPATRAAVRVIIESGVLYFVMQLVFAVTFGVNNPGKAIMVLITTPIYVRD